MRMWMLPPETMCRKHLLGEHNEIHMLAGSLLLGKRLDGFIAKKLLEPRSMRKRHDALAAEMLRRGYQHESPLPDVAAPLARYEPDVREALVDVGRAKKELMARCPDCARLLAEQPQHIAALGDTSAR